jgi:hypothetical protein
MEVTTETGSSVVEEISLRPQAVDAGFPEYLCHVGKLSEGEWVYAVALKDPLGEEGRIFPAEIVTESIAPVKFVVN